MAQKTLLKIAGALGAATLALTLASCSGGQSVADACKIANTEISKASSSMQSDLSAAMQGMTSGETPDFNALFDPILEGLDSAEKKVTNEEVKKPLSTFTSQYRDFAKSLEGFEMPDMSSIDPTDSAAVAEATEGMQELSTKITEDSSKLMESGQKLQEVCNAG
ncbi:hypothetical protein D3248_05735 [Leucobacter zeae]|nr:hypothetical protein [Leucobacter zeae]